MKIAINISLFITLVLGSAFFNGPIYPDNSETSGSENPKLEIKISYEHQSGRGSNQYAVWIENSGGEVVKTLFVTKFTADGGYSYRQNCVPLWLSKAKPSEHSKEEIDAYTGATPSTGIHTYMWDFTDSQGNRVKDGEYYFFVEGTLINTSTVIFKGSFNKNTKEQLIESKPEFNSEDITNKGMLKSVTARYIPK